MQTLASTAGACGTARFAGVGTRIVPPTICLADAACCERVVGVLVEKGRAPSNEVRLLLRPGHHHQLTVKEWRADRQVTCHDDLRAVVQNFTLDQAFSVAANGTNTKNDEGRSRQVLVETVEGVVVSLCDLTADACAAGSESEQLQQLAPGLAAWASLE